MVTHQLQYLADVSDIVLIDAGTVAVHGNLHQLKNSEFNKFLWMTGEQDTNDQCIDQSSNSMELAEMTADVEKKQRIQHAKQKITSEDQIVGTIGFDVFKAYFASVESRWLIVCVLATLIIEQFSTSFVDLFISKW